MIIDFKSTDFFQKKHKRVRKIIKIKRISLSLFNAALGRMFVK